MKKNIIIIVLAVLVVVFGFFGFAQMIESEQLVEDPIRQLQLIEDESEKQRELAEDLRVLLDHEVLRAQLAEADAKLKDQKIHSLQLQLDKCK